MSKFFKFRVHRWVLMFSLLFTTIGCDQVTKQIIRETLPETHALSYMGGSVIIQHMENPGAFLSLGATLPEALRFWIFTALVAAVLLSTSFYILFKNKAGKWETIGMTLLTAGDFGNLIDRIFRSSVTDFIHMNLGPLKTGVFNVADVAITFGAFLLILSAARQRTSA